MFIRALARLSTLTLLAVVIACAQANAVPPLAIVNVNVVPMDTERVLEHQTVLIRDGRIVALGSSRTLPAGTQKIDGTNKFLMPGLIDAHVHLMSPDDLISYVAYGVTTVVNMSGTPADLRLRQQVRSGRRIGPNIYTAGPTIDGYPPLNEAFATAETPAQGATLVTAHKKAGYDFIKLYGTLRPDVFREIAATCRRQHIALTGHVNRQLPTSEVFAAGQVLAAHAEDLLFARFDQPPSDADLLAFVDEVAKSGVTVTANVALNPSTAAQVQDLDKVLASPEAQYLSAATYSRCIRANNRNLDEDPKQHLQNLEQSQALVLKFVRLLHNRKVPLILGTDASAYGFPGQSVWDELRQTQAAGLSRFEALATATRNTGTYLSTNIDPRRKVGTIAADSSADLLLLNANPLAADLSQANIEGVILRGRYLPISEITRQRDLLKQRTESEHAAVDAIDQALEKGDTSTARKRLANRPLLDEWVLLTKSRKHEDNPPVAIHIAHLYVSQFPDSFAAHQLLADLLQKSGKNHEAQFEARIALQLQPDATAANLLKRATFSNIASTFSPGTFQLEFQGSQPSTSRLQLERKGPSWTGSLDIEQTATPLRTISAGSNQLWFKAGENFQEKEIRLTISPDGTVTGSWFSMFGRNGSVRGHRIP